MTAEFKKYEKAVYDNKSMTCRRCAVAFPDFPDRWTFKADCLADTRRSAFKHLVEFHADRAVALLGMFGNLLLVTQDYLDSALRDHNSEGDFNIQNVRLDSIKRDQELYDAAVSVRINEVLKEQ